VGSHQQADPDEPDCRRGARGKRNTAVKPDKAWTGEEVKRFFNFTAEDRRLHPIWQLAIAGRLRRGELCGLM
jgi:integrase